MTSHASNRWHWLAALVLFLAVVAIYRQTINADFIGYDDPAYVTENPHVKSGLSWANAAWSATAIYAANWHPLTWLSHQLDAQLYGLQPGGHHLTNLLLHAGNSILLLLLLLRATRSFATSLVVAALFAVHPANVESVAWISERKNVLSTLCCFLCLLAYLRYVAQPSLKRYLPVALLFAIGLMAKPMLVTLPCVLLLLDWWPLGRFAAAGGPQEATAEGARPQESPPIPPRAAKSRTVLLLGAEKIPLLLLSAGSCIITMIAQQETIITIDALPLMYRASNSVHAYARYIGMLLWPVNLGMYYPFPERWPAGLVAGSAILSATLTLVAVFWYLKRPWFAVGWLWFLGTMVPVIGIVQVAGQAMADRYAYLPFIGLFVILAWGSAELLRPKIYAVVWTTVALGFAITSWAQASYWRDSETLFAHTAAVTDRNARAFRLLGASLMQQDRLNEAYTFFKRAWELQPRYDNVCALGLIMAKLGHVEEARDFCQRALAKNPSQFTDLLDMAVLLEQLGDLPLAHDYAARSRQSQPDNPQALFILANILAKLGRDQEAEPLYRQVVAQKADHAEAYVNLGALLERRGASAEAGTCYETAAALQPENVTGLLNLARLRLQGGRTQDATGLMETARRLAPHNPDVLKSYAIALAVQGRTGDAVRYLKRAVALKPDDLSLLLLLAQMLTDTGAIPAAVQAYEHAIALAPADNAPTEALTWLYATRVALAESAGAKLPPLCERLEQPTANPRQARTLQILAAARARCGDPQKAVAWATQAQELAQRQNDSGLVMALEKQLASYRNGQPWTE